MILTEATETPMQTGAKTGAKTSETALAAAVQARREAGPAVLAEVRGAGAVTFTDHIRRRAAAWPDREALVWRGRGLSYARLLDRIDRARAALAAAGVQPGQPVALLLGNSDLYVVWYLAALDLGAIAVPLNTRLAPREAAYILRHSQAVLLLTEPAFADLLAELATAHGMAVATLTLDPRDPESGLTDARAAAAPALGPDAPAAVYYTSGTTGRPKGVVHTHASLLAITLQSPPAWEYDHDGLRMLAVTPLFHIAAHTAFFPALMLGGTLVVDTYDTAGTLELIRDGAITAVFAVPSILLLLVDAARMRSVTLDRVRTVMFGAAPMTISKLGDVQGLFPNAGLVHGMGQTESGGTLVTLPSVAAFARAGSVGTALAGVEVAIFDDHDRPVPPGTVGELVARGPNLMQGYLRNDAATRDTLRGGWLHTGDLGFQDPDGLVTLVDRKKDMIIRGGENIYCSEVEQVLLRHPAIKAAAVVGQPDALFGEQVAAFLVADPGLPRPGEDEIAAHCRGQLADYKVPVTLRFVDELPLTATGKIRKVDLRQSLPPYERAQRGTGA